jgi:glutathione S-transferase
MNLVRTSALPILYSFRRCPYAMRARLALRASGVEYALQEVALKNKPAEMLLASPKGTVPVLVLTDGTVLEQSLDIMLWALGRHDSPPWLPPTDVEHEAQLELIGLWDGEFKHHLDRYKYPHRFALQDGLEHRASGSRFLQQLEHTLQQQAHLTGANWGLADAAIAPFVRQWAHTDPAWFSGQSWPRLQQWLAAFECSADFAEVMQKLPLNPPAQEAPAHPLGAARAQ